VPLACWLAILQVTKRSARMGNAVQGVASTRVADDVAARLELSFQSACNALFLLDVKGSIRGYAGEPNRLPSHAPVN
jgi:hypothetical protein